MRTILVPVVIPAKGIVGGAGTISSPLAGGSPITGIGAVLPDDPAPASFTVAGGPGASTTSTDPSRNGSGCFAITSRHPGGHSADFAVSTKGDRTTGGGLLLLLE